MSSDPRKPQPGPDQAPSRDPTHVPDNPDRGPDRGPGGTDPVPRPPDLPPLPDIPAGDPPRNTNPPQYL